MNQKPHQLSPADLQSIVDNKTKPIGSLGQLEELACQVALLQQTTTPMMESCELIIFIGDHGIVEDGVSAFPQAVTTQMARNFLSGGAAANVFARTNNIGVTLVDAGMAEAIEHEQLIDACISRSTQNFRVQPAMTPEQRDKALAEGSRVTKELKADALCFGEMGIGNTSAATLLLHKLLQIPLKKLVGRGTGVDDQGLVKKAAILSEAAARTSTHLSATDALMEYGGFEIAMMVGGMLAASEQGTLVLVDGFIATAAAVIAMNIQPDCKAALVFSHQSAESGHQVVLNHLNVRPLFDLGLRLGEGTGALLAWPLVRNAVAMLNEMASFESAKIDGPNGI